MNDMMDILGLRDYLRSTPTPPTVKSDPDALRQRALEILSRINHTGRRARLTSDRGETSLFKSALDVIAPFQAESFWRDGYLDRNTLDRVSLDKLLEILTDLSPEMSRGVWDFQRMCNPGWTIKVKRPGAGEQDSEDKRGRAVVDEFLQRLKGRHKSVNVIFDRFFMGVWLRGAFAGETVMAKDRRTAIDLVTPDPAAFRFRKVTDPEYGEHHELGQWIDGKWVPLEYPTVAYIPLDSLPGVPYGRAPSRPGVVTAIFLLGFVHDLKRVIAQQGYPRHDIEIQLDVMMAFLSQAEKNSAEAIEKAINKLVSDTIASYEVLEPDDAWVHTNSTKLNRPVGTLDSGSLGAVDGLVKFMERMTVRALKTMPLVFGMAETVSEANSNRQWEIYVAGIKTVQHLVEDGIEALLNAALQAAGVQAVAEIRFAELRAAEMLRDAQTREKEIANAARERDEGWISQDEAAQKVVKHDAVAPAPVRAPLTPGSGNQPNPDPGADRGKRNLEAAALLASLPSGEPADEDVDSALRWWRVRAPEPARELISAEES